MSETVTVALLGNPEAAFDNAAFTWLDEGGAEEFAVPWADLPKVVLQVDHDETIHGVLTRALRESGVQVPQFMNPDDPALSWVMFRRDDEPASSQRFQSILNLVQGDGRIRWAVPYKQVTIGELLRAADAGLVAGDPRQMYLILLPPQGNGLMFTWSGLFEGLRIAWTVIGAAATAGGALAFGREVLGAARDRLGNGREVLQERYLDWENADPHNFVGVLEIRAWHTDDLAERLGCSPQEAEAILWAFGYTRAPSGLWRRDGDDAARLVHMVNDNLTVTQAWNPAANFEAEMRRRTQQLLETGAPPPDPQLEAGEDYEEPEPEDYEEPVDDGLTFACACGCGAEMEIYRFYPAASADDRARLKFRFSAETDHFVIEPEVLGAVLGAMVQ